MRRMRIIQVLMAFVAMTYVVSCQRIPLYERYTNVKLELEVLLDMENEVSPSVPTELDDEYLRKVNGEMPEYVEALFYDPNTHQLVKSQILDAKGGFLDLPSGDYDMVVYSFGTESTQIGSHNHRLEAEAFTSDISEQMASKMAWYKSVHDFTKVDTKGYEDDPIIHEPDHLYVGRKYGINIPAFTTRNETVTIKATARTIIDVYCLEVLGVKGTENIDIVEAFITGQIKSNYFGRGERSSDPATIYTDMRIDHQNRRLYSVFETFGKLPGETNNIYLDITVKDSDGGQYRYIFDVTDQFDDPDNVNHRLIIDATEIIDIPDSKNAGGGLSPSVDEWQDEIIDVPLG